MFLAFVEKVKPVFEEYEHSHPKITKKIIKGSFPGDLSLNEISQHPNYLSIM